MVCKFWIIQPVYFDAFGHFITVGTIHQFEPVVKHIVTAHKVMAYTDRPTCRGNVYCEVFLYFINNIKDITAFTIHLVTKCQDWQIA